MANVPVDTQKRSARRWWILAVVCVAQLLDVLDVTIVNIALPRAQADLGFSLGDRQWIVTAYSLAFGALLLFFGRVGDLLGRRATLLLGLGVFAIASVIGGAADTFAVLVIARAVQGVAAAMIAPAALALLSTTFTHEKNRATAFAIFGAISGSGAAIGMLLGGMLTSHFGWRSTLFVNVGISLLAFAGTAALIAREPRAHERPALDVSGALLASTGLFAVVFGLSNAESHFWRAPQTWAFLAAGTVLMAAFLWRQTRAPQPLLPPRVLLDRTRAGANLAVFIAGTGLFGAFLFLNYYMQDTLRYSPIATGIAFLPMVATLAITGGICTTQLYPRLGARPPVAVGMLVAAGAMAWLARIGPESTYITGLLGPLMLFGIGVGAIVAPAMSAGTVGVEPRDAGIASATINTAQQLGGAIGIAVLNSLAASAINRRLTDSHATHAAAAVYSDTIAFWYTSAVFTVGAIACGLILPSRQIDDAR